MNKKQALQKAREIVQELEDAISDPISYKMYHRAYSIEHIAHIIFMTDLEARNDQIQIDSRDFIKNMKDAMK